MERIDINKTNEFLLAFKPIKKHDILAVEVIRESLKAIENGNFGVGAILVNDEGSIVCRGQNRVFSQSRSDLHAEMDLLNNFEKMHREESRELNKKMVLFTSLELFAVPTTACSVFGGFSFCTAGLFGLSTPIEKGVCSFLIPHRTSKTSIFSLKR